MTNAKTPPTTAKQANAELNQLLREGVAAIKMGDKTSARAKLKEVVARDQNNEKGWLYLASVVETVDERRVCLGNVTVINPKNEKARIMLEQLSGNPNAGLIMGDADFNSPARSPLGGMSKRRLLVIGALVGAIVIVLAIAVSILSGGHNALPPTPTIASIAAMPTGATAAATLPAESTGSATGAATNSLDGTPGSSPAAVAMAGTGAATAKATLPLVAPTLPPSWTPEPSATLSGQIGTPLAAPPAGLTGRLVLASGSLLSNSGNLPIFISDPYGKSLQPVSGSDAGDYGILTPDGQRLIYARFLASTNAQQLRASFSNGTRFLEMSTLWGNVPPLANAKMPSISLNGTVLVFSATNLAENESMPGIFMVPAKTLPPYGTADSSAPTTVAANVAPTITKIVPPTLPKSGKATKAAPTVPGVTATTQEPPTPTALGALTTLRRVTAKNTGANTWPAVSPDGTKVLYVGDTTPIGSEGVDLYLIDINGGAAKNLTNDMLDNVEAAPEWSPDGKQIAYQVMAKGAQTNDIWLMSADGSNKAALVTGSGDNVRPHWSPDGKYIAFSSTRNGKWDVYVVEVQSKTIYQVTQTSASTICTAWGPK